MFIKVLSIIYYGNEINYVMIKNIIRNERKDTNKENLIIKKYDQFFKNLDK